MLTIEKFSLGVSDRFAHPAAAQLRACQMIAADDVDVVPVWNESHREHSFIGSEPASVAAAARAAVEALGWRAARCAGVVVRARAGEGEVVR